MAKRQRPLLHDGAVVLVTHPVGPGKTRSRKMRCVETEWEGKPAFLLKPVRSARRRPSKRRAKRR